MTRASWGVVLLVAMEGCVQLARYEAPPLLDAPPVEDEAPAAHDAADAAVVDADTAAPDDAPPDVDGAPGCAVGATRCEATGACTPGMHASPSDCGPCRARCSGSGAVCGQHASGVAACCAYVGAACDATSCPAPATCFQTGGGLYNCCPPGGGAP